MSKSNSKSKTGDREARLIVCVCFAVHFLLEGLQRCSGLFYVLMVTRGRQWAALPFAVGKAVSTFSCIMLETSRKNKKPYEWFLYGILLSSCGLGFCYFIKSVIWLSVFWGGIFSAGIGISRPLIFQKLQNQKEHSLFPFISSQSSTFACLILPFIMNIIVYHFGRKECFIAFACVILSCFPIAMIVKKEMKIRFPNINLSLKNRSKTYKMSETDAHRGSNLYQTTKFKEFSEESFTQYLEPDILQTVGGCKNCVLTKKDAGIECIFQPIFKAKMKLVDEQKSSNARNDVSLNDQDVYVKGKLTKLVDDIRQYEKSHMLYEDTSNIDTRSPNSLSSDETKCCSDLVSTGSLRCCESSSSCNESSVSAISNDVPPKDMTSADDLKKSNGRRHNAPLEIKVHVVECTVTTNEDVPNEPKPAPRNGYRRHSNSLITAHYENVDFTKLLQRKHSKSPALHKLQCNLTSRMYLISEDEELEPQCVVEDYEGTLEVKDPEARKQSTTTNTLLKFIKPSNLAIVYMYVLYEFTLALMLLIIADISLDDRINTIHYDFVLASFGSGGIIGCLSCKYLGHKLLSDGSHAATAIIFLLNALAVAGILWSGNIFWLSGFYVLLGFIECGIVYTLPKLVADNIEPEISNYLEFVCRSLSVVAFLSIPFAIGLSRDSSGDYDNLLRVTSCLSVICAVLCYFLPRLTKVGQGKHRQPSYVP